MNVKDWIKLIGFLFVIAATVLITVYIPHLDNLISNSADTAENFKESRLMTAITILHYDEQLTRRHIELSDAFQHRRAGDKKSWNLMMSRASNTTANIAQQWCSVFSGGEKDLIRVDIDKEIKKIAENKNLSVVQQYDKVNKIMIDARREASERLDEAQNDWNLIRRNLRKLQNKKNSWYIIFCLLQITGLILFSGAEIFEKITQKSNSGQSLGKKNFPKHRK